MRRILLAPVLILSAVLALRASQAPSRPAESAAPAEAIRLNNLGVASMNQQKFEQGLQWFEKAAAADPKLVVARVNQAIALINLQRYEPARELLDGGHDRPTRRTRAPGTTSDCCRRARARPRRRWRRSRRPRP